MKVDVLLGLQWGDEGKGKVVDVLTPRYDVVARFQGGPNAGHTLEFEGQKYVLRSIPSGIFQGDKVNIIGNGVVLDPSLFKAEAEALEASGHPLKERLHISKMSVITMILNVVLLIIGFFTCGREFGAKTVYTSVLLPVFLGLFEKLFPGFGSMTGSQELDVLCYILVVSIGLSILFNRNASSGGLDIVAKIMNKYLHMELGKAMSLSGMCVALSAALVYDKKTVVLSILGTYFNGIVLDHFIFDSSIKRRVCIITEKEEALRQFILYDLHSGATMYEAIGAYNLEKHNEIITIVDKSEYQKLMNFINREDPKAFVTVYNVSSMQYQPKI